MLVTISEAAKSRSENIRQQIPVELREPRFLILCPASLVENWWDELFLWPPVMSTSIGPIRKVSSAILHGQRLTEIRSWNEEGGVLLLGYDTFRDLIHNKPRANRAAALDVDEHEDIKKALLDRPNLVVADEAHQFKNRAKALNRAMSQFRTTSRIALTGTPLSNDLGEYYSVIDWIAPDYLGTPAEFKATYEEPIHDGLYQDSTNSQYRVSRKILKALELELEPKVHRAGVARLHAELKGKMEFVVRVPLTKLQESLYRIYAESMISASRGGEPRSATLWSWLNILQLLCNHPESFRKSLLIIQAELVGHAKPDPKKPQNAVADNELPGSGEDLALLDEPVSQAGLSRIISDTQKVFDDLTTPLNSLSHSNKMQILMNILIFSQAANDKVLVFSHRIPTLNYVALQLEKLGMSYARIDGKLLPQKRQPITKEFNDGQTNVCLVSTRAGGTGLNLFGANRVVILDENFNPSWEQQAIGRAYRIGQQKTVYVYRLTVGGTFEQTIQNQAIFKEQLATRVVDKRNPSRGALKGSGQYLFLPKTLDREDLDPFLGNDPLVLDRLIADQTK